MSELHNLEVRSAAWNCFALLTTEAELRLTRGDVSKGDSPAEIQRLLGQAIALAEGNNQFRPRFFTAEAYYYQARSTEPATPVLAEFVIRAVIGNNRVAVNRARTRPERRDRCDGSSERRSGSNRNGRILSGPIALKWGVKLGQDFTPEEMVYLVEESGEGTIDTATLVEPYYRAIFEEELGAWHRLEDAWPRLRDLTTVLAWFDIEVHSMVIDLGARWVRSERYKRYEHQRVKQRGVGSHDASHAVLARRRSRPRVGVGQAVRLGWEWPARCPGADGHDC